MDAVDAAVSVVLDKSKFLRPLPSLALRIPKQYAQLLSKILSSHLLDMPRVRHIVPDAQDPDMRLVLLSTGITKSGIEGLPEETKQAIAKIVPLDFVMHDVVLDYNYWPVEYILKEILPPGCEVPSSFETIGHISHLNLREDLLPFKKVIAQVILDKNPKLKTVVNKVGTIKNEFRVPEFEVLAGDSSLLTEVKQHGATFRLDYGKVYWNSRLEGEHKRLFCRFKPGEVVVDMFAGIGPFAIPAAQQGCVVYANDKNPDSVEYLKLNSDINKVGKRVKAFNMDAREFMQELINERAEKKTVSPVTVDVKNVVPWSATSDVGKRRGEKKGKAVGPVQITVSDSRPWEHMDHIVMNLPAKALEFLDVLNGLLSKEMWKGPMPKVHCYCFMRTNETNEDILKRAESYLGGCIANSDVHVVRDVAPNKTMLCVTFDLPEAVAFGSTTVSATLDQSGVDASAVKRARTG